MFVPTPDPVGITKNSNHPRVHTCNELATLVDQLLKDTKTLTLLACLSARSITQKQISTYAQFLIYVYVKRKALLVQLEDSVLTVHLGNLSITDLFYIKTLIVGGLSMRGLGLAIVLIATGSD